MIREEVSRLRVPETSGLGRVRLGYFVSMMIDAPTTDPTSTTGTRAPVTLFGPALETSTNGAGQGFAVTAGRWTRRAAAGALVVVGLAACSTPGEPAETGDPVPGTADVTVADVDVEDGTEGGLDLDNGNVPGSESDQDLDPYDEQNDLNTEGSDDS